MLDADAATLTAADLNERLLAAHTDRVRLDAAECRWLAEWDARQVWAVDGALSGTAWLRNHHGVASVPMRERLRVARQLRSMPVTAAAFDAGELSYEKVRLLARARTDATAVLFARDESMLVDSGRVLDADQFAKVVRYWQAMADAAGHANDAKACFDGRYGSASELLDGMLKVDAMLDPEASRIFKGVLDEIVDEFRRADRRDTGNGTGVAPRSHRQLVADAFGEMARRAAASTTQTTGRSRTEMVIVVPADLFTDNQSDTTDPDDATDIDDSTDDVDGMDDRTDGDHPTHADDTTGTVDSAGMVDVDDSGVGDVARASYVAARDDTAGRTDQATRRRSGNGEGAGAGGTIGQGDTTATDPATAADPTAASTGRGPSAGSARGGRAGPGGTPRLLPTFDNGVPITADTARRLACNAVFRRVVLGTASEILDLGRLTPVPSAAQRRAVMLRDGGCTFAGCDMPTNRCEIHHLEHYHRGSRTGGSTDLHNLALVCRRHHHLAHEGGFTMSRNGVTGAVETHRPDGTPIPTRPRAGPLHPYRHDHDDPGDEQLPRAS